MTNHSNEDMTTLPPDDAFAALGNETRIEILQALGDADEPLPFSELHDRVEMRDSGQFNYHLDKLEGHFVRKTDDGYTLRQAGNRVIEAVLSGAVTNAPVIEPTEVDTPCIYCGAPIVVSFREESVRMYCTDCAGTYGDSILEEDPSHRQELDETKNYGFLGELALPSAGIQGRSSLEVLETAFIWGMLELLATARGVCPRCAARVEESVSVCEEHDAANGICDQCDYRHAVIRRTSCTNCTAEGQGPFIIGCLANTQFLNFLTDHGFTPFGNHWMSALEWHEEILSTDPFEARFHWTLDTETLTITVDEDLSVVDVTRGTTSETA